MTDKVSVAVKLYTCIREVKFVKFSVGTPAFLTEAFHGVLHREVDRALVTSFEILPPPPKYHFPYVFMPFCLINIKDNFMFYVSWLT
jgi:hypothetical protein